ncbi:hypothetical protein EYF80_039730 [Liparis tanakae]|uniref:Uncharacterized protein n=1 Tax=Liparis tanakae TaxID=230148 RepID=A0A4Z2GBP8_9TELE|nr:hypothetical protein EYF80_039730 [Liparis tanakae]
MTSPSLNCSTSSSNTASFMAGANSRPRGPEKERGDGVLRREVLLSKAVRPPPPSTASRPRRGSEPREDATPSRPACETEEWGFKGRFSGRTIEEETVTHSVVPLALLSDWLVQVLLAAVAEALDGLGDAAQRAVDLIRVHVLRVVLHHATGHTDTGTHRDVNT